jgi:hypothetical protein
MTAILDVAIALATATAEFDAVKSDPSRNVAVGRRVYEADVRFKTVMRELLQKEPTIVAALRSKVSEAQ